MSARLRGAAAFALLLALGCGRKNTAPSSGAVASASASVTHPSPSASAPPPPSAVRCRPLPGETITLGGGAPEPSLRREVEEDDSIDLPYSPEIGVATAFEGGFAVAALEPKGKSTAAVVVVVGAHPVRVELGPVHGDVPPPSVAAAGANLIVAAPEGAPHGATIRLARVENAAAAPSLQWGASIQEGSDESDAFALAVAEKSAVLAWDEWNAHDEHGEIRLVSFSPGDVSKASAVSVISGNRDDVESPSVVARPGGFWAAWVVNVQRQPDKKASGASTDQQGVVDLGPRYVAVVPLDGAGKVIGAPLAASPRDGHAAGFDVATLPDGSALVAWRDDATSAGAPGGTVRLSTVRLDGSMEPLRVGDDEASVGTPSLLVDPAPPGDVGGWLALTNEADAARLLSLDRAGRPLDSLAIEPSLGVAAPLAVRGGRVLVGRPRGKAVTLDAFTCVKGAPPAP